MFLRSIGSQGENRKKGHLYTSLCLRDLCKKQGSSATVASQDPDWYMNNQIQGGPGYLTKKRVSDDASMCPEV